MEKRVNRWLESINISEEEKNVIRKMSEEERAEAFHQDVPFGTAGMRGVMGLGDNRINKYTIRKAAEGYAQYIESLDYHQKIAIAYDNRNHSKEFAEETAAIMAKHGIEVYIYPELMPTPLLSYAVRELECAGGVVITASHNPKEYNGFKVYHKTGRQLLPNEVEKVIHYVNLIEDPLSIDTNLTDQQQALIKAVPDHVISSYKDIVLGAQVVLNPKDIKVVFSPQHGTATKIVPEVLTTAGYEVIKVEEQCLVDGNFSNTKSPNPESPLSYELPLEYAKKHQAEVIIITDPDADRIGIAVHHEDDYKLLNGNETAALMLDYLINVKHKGEDLSHRYLINTVVTSDIGEVIAHKHNVKIKKTLTGFKYLGEEINHLSNDEYLFAYEESYGTLPIPIVRDKDAVSASLLVAEIVQYHKNNGDTLIDALEHIYKENGYYIDRQDAIEMKGIDGPDKIKAMIAKLNEIKVGVYNGLEIERIENYQQRLAYTAEGEEALSLPQELMTKLFVKDMGWLAIRPSGTEPKVKLYYSVKGQTQQDAENNYAKIADAFHNDLTV